MLQLGLIILDEYCILIKLEHKIVKSLIFVFYFSFFFCNCYKCFAQTYRSILRICIVFSLVRDDFSIFSLRKFIMGITAFHMIVLAKNTFP